MNEYPGKLISHIYRKSQMYWAGVLKEYDITTAEYPLLIVLNREDGITQEKIVSDLNLDKSAVARSIKSLMEKGFVERKKDDKDLRCNRIYLTKRGKDSWIPIQNAMKEINDIFSRDIETKEIDQVIKILSKMKDNIEDYFKK